MSDLEESFEDGILTLTMNRPKARNAMSGDMTVSYTHLRAHET